MTTINGKPIDELLESDDFKKSLKDAEHVVQFINKHYISLNDSDCTIYAEHLKTGLTKLVALMKSKDELFNRLYQKEHFAGSYPDGLKIGKPCEYDMNLIIKLPVDTSKLEFETGTPSFVMIRGKEAFHDAASLSTDILAWLDKEGYLLQTKFRDWMESVLTKALNTLPRLDGPTAGNTRCLTFEKNGEGVEYKIAFKKSGPAMTLNVTTPENSTLDVDLVPAFQFGPPILPPSVSPLLKSCNKKSWMVVPKPKKLKEGEKVETIDTREWRMSFLDQEREILSGTGTVKPTIKLLKKLRDSAKVKLSSYAIKTVVLLEMREQKSEFWKNRLIYIFLFMLNRLIVHIKTGHIPSYWDDRDDLLKLNKIQYDNFGNQLLKILKDIIKVVGCNPFIIAEKLLTKDQLENVKINCKIPNSNGLKNIEEGKGEVDGAEKGRAYEQVTDHGNLNKILQKLEDIHTEQQKLAEQFAQRVSVSSEPFQHTDRSNHGLGLKKQSELDERVNDLEDMVTLMRKEIEQLKSQLSLSVLK